MYRLVINGLTLEHGTLRVIMQAYCKLVITESTEVTIYKGKVMLDGWMQQPTR